MTENKEQGKDKKLGLSRPGKLELKKTLETGQVRQSFSHGRSKMVTVEVLKKRNFAPDFGGHMTEVTGGPVLGLEEQVPPVVKPAPAEIAEEQAPPSTGPSLTEEEKATRARALEDAKKTGDPEADAALGLLTEGPTSDVSAEEIDETRRAEEADARRISEEEEKRREEQAKAAAATAAAKLEALEGEEALENIGRPKRDALREGRRLPPRRTERRRRAGNWWSPPTA